MIFLASCMRNNLLIINNIYRASKLGAIFSKIFKFSSPPKESIMTPRSRKPLMLPGALVGGGTTVADQTTAMLQSSFSSLREEDESDVAAAIDGNSSNTASNRLMCRSKSEGDFNEILLDDQRQLLHTKVLSEGSKLSLVAGDAAAAATQQSLSSPFR